MHIETDRATLDIDLDNLRYLGYGGNLDEFILEILHIVV